VLHIVSAQFAGNNTVARHRMIYSALGVLMKREIHALTIQAHTPDEI
jgi:BolA protein